MAETQVQRDLDIKRTLEHMADRLREGFTGRFLVESEPERVRCEESKAIPESGRERGELPRSSRRYLTYMAQRLRDGWIGRFLLDCTRGGVSRFEETRTVAEADIREIR